jgi:hypothetical protein
MVAILVGLGADVRPVVEAVSARHLAAENWVGSHSSPCEMCGGQSSTGTGFPSASINMSQ